MTVRAVLILMAILGASRALAQPAPENGSVEGQVVSLATGAPISGAAVTLAVNMGRTLSTRPSFPKAQTDEQGRFAFRNLGPGIYNLVAQRQGFLRTEYRSIGSHTVVLGEDQSLRGVVLTLIPEASLAVKATDSGGQPLRMALIRLLRSGPPTFPAMGRTNDAGECRIANLAPGDYVLEANPPDRRSPPPGQPLPAEPELAEVATYYPDATDPGKGAAIHIEPGEARSVEIALKKAPTVSIHGRLVDHESQGGPTLVRLVARGAPDRSLFTWSPTIGADGSFTIAGVTPGSYYLAAERSRLGRDAEPAAAGTAITRVITSGSVTTQAAAARPIEIGSRNLDGITLDMAPIFDLQGTVTVEENAQCRFTSGVDSFTTVLLSPEVPGATSNAPLAIGRGVFTLRNVAHIPYRLRVSDAGDCYVKSIRYGGREAVDGVVDFTGDGPLEVVFAMGKWMDVAVVDGNGRPSARATVTLVPKDGAPASIQSILATSIGSYALHAIRPGSYNLFAWEEVFDTTPRQELLPKLLKTFADRATPVTVETAGSAVKPRIEMISAAEIARFSGPLSAPPPVKAKGGIAGLALDSASGAPLKGVTLSLKGWREATPEASAETDERGRFAFGDLEPGFYNLSAQRPGFGGAKYGLGESPFGSIILGEGQQVTGIEMMLQPIP